MIRQTTSIQLQLLINYLTNTWLNYLTNTWLNYLTNTWLNYLTNTWLNYLTNTWLNYLTNTWLDNPTWSVQQWSVFRQTVRTNNDVEGWHRPFIGKAGGSNLHFYQLVPALMKESRSVGLTVRLVEEQSLRRYQRVTYMYKKSQGRLTVVGPV